MSSAQAQQQMPDGDVRLQKELTLEETLRVMDVAREMRDQRVTAEKMFRQDSIRQQLREKLLRQAKALHEDVSEAEIDAAIDQYLATQHRFQKPDGGFKNFVAHCWVWRDRILLGAAAVAGAAVAAGGIWMYFF